MIEHASANLAARGVRFVSVLTLGPSVPEDVPDGYDGTRRFYRAAGFTPLRELDLRSWDDESALLLVRALGLSHTIESIGCVDHGQPVVIPWLDGQEP